MRWLRCVGFCSVALAGLAGSVAFTADVALDEQIAKGIREVGDGDYDAAILTLDRAARRLANDPSKMKDLAQGYLYLGIAYVGKGHEAAARAKFREAVQQMQDLSLSPEQFPPKVIDLFEAAKEEARRFTPAPAAQPAARTPATQVAAPPAQAAQPAPTTRTSAEAAAPARKKGGSKKWLLIGGGAAGLAAAGAVAAGSQKSDSGGTDQPKQPITSPWEGDLLPGDHYRTQHFGPAGPGAWQAKFNWATEEGEDPDLLVQFTVWDPEGRFMLTSRQTADRMTQEEFSGPAGRYQFAIETNIPPRRRVHFWGTVTHPAP